MRNYCTELKSSYRKYPVPESIHIRDVSPGWTRVFTKY